MWLSFLAAAVLTWTPPTLNEDGSLLTDLASYDIWYGCTTPGAYDTVETLLAPATTYTVVGLPDTGTCYFAAKAVNSSGVASIFSNEATKVLGSLAVPGVVSNTQITWQESPVMAISFIGFGTAETGGTTVVITPHADTANGDMMVAFSVGEASGDHTPASGFTTIDEASHTGTNFRMESHFQILTGAPDPTYTFLVAANGGLGQILTFRGVSWDDPTAVSTTHAISEVTSATHASPSVTLAAGDAVVIGWGSDGANTVSTAPVPPMTAVGTSGDATPSIELATYYELAPGAGAYSETLVWSGSDQQICTAVVISEAGGGASLSIPVAMHQYARLRNN